MTTPLIIKNRYKNNNYACNVIVSNSIDIYNMSSVEELQRQIQRLQQQLFEQQNQDSSSNATGHLTGVPAAPVVQPAPAVHVTSTVPPHHNRHHHQAHQVEPETDIPQGDTINTLPSRTVFLGVDLFRLTPENTDYSKLVKLGRQDQTFTNVDEEPDAYRQHGIELLSEANRHLGDHIENMKNDLIFNNLCKRAESFGVTLNAKTRASPPHANVATSLFHDRAELEKWACCRQFSCQYRSDTYLTSDRRYTFPFTIPELHLEWLLSFGTCVIGGRRASTCPQRVFIKPLCASACCVGF
jgi:hypothetical protein